MSQILHHTKVLGVGGVFVMNFSFLIFLRRGCAILRERLISKSNEDRPNLSIELDAPRSTPYGRRKKLCETSKHSFPFYFKM